MFFWYGTRLYGKVDHAPGLFYVATTFFHINFVPLVPTESYLIMDDGTGESGVPISMSVRSVLVGWFRAVAFVVGSVMTLTGAFNSSLDHIARVRTLGGGVALLALAVASYWVCCIGRERAVRRAEGAGLNPGFVHDHFDRLEGKPLSEWPRNEKLEGKDLDEALRRWNPNQHPEN